MRLFADGLIASETRENSPGENPPAFVVCDKLRPHLAMLMGDAGFRSLLSRALALTNAQGDWLRDVKIKPDGSLGESDETGNIAHRKHVARGGVILVTQLLELLVAFIGEKLAVGLVCDIWPNVSQDGLTSPNREKNEETK
jgi:hypothetical protein